MFVEECYRPVFALAVCSSDLCLSNSYASIVSRISSILCLWRSSIALFCMSYMSPHIRCWLGGSCFLPFIYSSSLEQFLDMIFSAFSVSWFILLCSLHFIEPFQPCCYLDCLCCMGKAARGTNIKLEEQRNNAGYEGETSESVGVPDSTGAETWTMRKHERRKIDAFELWCWRRGIPRQRWLDTLKGYTSGATISKMRRDARDREGWRGAATAVARGRMRLAGTR